MNGRVITDSMARDRLARARLTAISEMPYLATALMSMTFISTPGLETIGIDERFRTYVDTDVLQRWSNSELAAALIHEVNHVLRMHHHRAPVGRSDADRWNIAGDLEINDDIAEAGLTLPQGCLMPIHYGLENGLTVEQYFEALGSSGSAPCCGSGATGRRQEWELDPTDPVGVPASRISQIADAVANEILASPPGSVPGGLTRWASARRPQIAWQTALNSVVRRGIARGAGHRDHSWSRPHRRHRGEVIMPSLRDRPVSIFCVVDTSGSMSPRLLDDALSEVAALSRHAGVAETWLASCDSAATFHGRFRNSSRVELFGGGGTSLEVALEIMQQQRIDPSVVVFLTDGHTEWSPSVPSPLRHRSVVVVTIGDGPDGPEWAEHLRCT